MYKIIKMSYLEIVKQYGNALEYIKDPSIEVQLAAVKQNGQALYYIKDPSEAVQLASVKQNGHAGKAAKDIRERDIKFIGEYVKVGCEIRTKARWLRTTFKEIEDLHSIQDALFLATVKKEIRRN